MKKLNKKTTIAVFAALCFTSLISLFYSCEVGLGSAVDTQPPSVSISYPPSLSVIRDSFVFAGNWNDDRTIEGVFVEVYQIRDDQKTIVFKDQAETTDKIDTEEEKKDGTWSITLNNYDAENPEWYNGWEFCDGDYEVQVYAKDKAGQVSSVASRTFSIDNTAPILLLTNPTSAGNDSSPATFGQIIQLTGTFYDFCGKISNLVVSFYDENGAAICDSTFSNITSMSDSSPLTIARYYSSEEEQNANREVFDNYVKLLGAEKLAKFENKENIDNSKVYFTVTAKDNAKVYKTIGDNGTGEGNSTNHFYRGTTSMQNLVSGDGGIEDFTLADFAMYLNGTSKKYISYSSKINEIENAARGCSVTTATNNDISQNISNTDSRNGDPVFLTFVLNPKNNPLYTVGGYEKIATPVSQLDSENYSDQGFKNIYAGTPVPLNISVGADNKNLSTHTISIFKLDKTNLAKAGITKEINQANFAEIFKKENNDKYFSLLWTWNSDIYETYNEWGIDKTSCYTVTDDDANVATISKQFVINSFEATHNYEFLVLGEDITGNNIISATTKGYGFCGKVSETAPKFSDIEGYTQNNTIVNESKLKGTSTATQADVLYLEGKIITDKPLFGESGFNYTITIVDSSDKTRKEIVTKNITVQNLQEEPNYSEDYKSNYCYKTSEESPFEYSWRFTTTEFANDNKVRTLITTAGSYEITLELTASNSETSSTTITKVYTLDNLAPEPTLSEIGVAVEKKLSETRSAYWINPKNKLTISGLVTDNLSTAKACETWVEFVGLSDVNNEDTNITWKSSSKTDVNKWTFEIPAEAFVANKDGVKKYGANLYIYSQDVAGNKNVPEAIPLWFDTEAPTGVHLIDSSFKDLYFRVGEQDRDDFIKTNADGSVTGTNGLTFDNDLDKNVGGKYSEGTYGNASTITLRGNYEDSGSGVAMIYYKVYQGTANDPTSRTDLEALKNEVKSQADGKFVPLAAGSEITKRVFYNDKTGNGTLSGKLSAGDVHSVEVNGVVKKYWTTVKSNFMTTISGFVTGENYLVLVAEDNVGNATVDYQKVQGITYNNFKVNVDNAVPTVTTGDEFSKSQYYRPRTDGTFEIYGIAEDENAGIRSLVVKANGKEITKDIDTYGTITTISSGIVVEETNDQGVKVYNIYGLKEDGTVDNEKLLLANISKEYYKENDTTFNTFTSNKVFWKTVLKDDIFKEDSENYIASGKSVSVQAIVTDNAGVGNTETYSIANITIDSKEPTVTIKNPKDNTEVNQTITISFVNSDGNGSGIDESAAAKPKLYYTEDLSLTDASTWTALDLSPAEADGGWSFTLDTTQFTSSSKNISIKISSQDNAGNIGYSDPLTLKINQDSDRPVIKLSNFAITEEGNLMTANAPVWFNRSEIYGIVTDDDGEISSIKAISKTVTSEGQAAAPTSSEWENAPELNDNGSWAFTIQDGPQNIYFRVVDAVGTEFISNATSNSTDSYGPKLIDKANEKAGYTDERPNDIIYTKVDTCDPALDDLYYYACSEIVSDVNSIAQSNWTKVEGIISEKFGGSLKRYLYLKYKASDTNGIYEINPRLKESDSNENDEGLSPKATYEISRDEKSLESIAYFDLNEDNNALTSGTKTLSMNIKDNASINGKGIFKESKLSVDNDPPNISFSNYESGSQVYGSSSVTLRGATVDDNKVNKVEYILTDTAAEPASDSAWTVITKDETINQYSYTSAMGWQILFDDQLEYEDPSSYHAELLKKALFRLYNVESTAQSAYDYNQNIYVWIRATDELGNRATNKTDKFYFDVIPNGDRPAIEISYPSDNSSAGGTIRITGTTDIQDTNASVTAVYIQIDPDYDGTTFNPNWYESLGEIIENKSNINYTISDAPGVIEKGIPVSGSKTSWHLTINASREFNTAIETDDEGKPTKYRTLGIRAYAVSSTNKISVSPTHKCSIDPEAPRFENLRFVQYDDYGTEIASRKYDSGINLKGEWFLVGSIEDDSGIKLLTHNSTNNPTATLVSGGNITSDGQGLVDEFIDTQNSVKNFNLKIPVGNATPDLFGKIEYEITAVDASENEADATLEFTINFDNKAPEFDVLTGNGKFLSEEENRIIRQSNGKYSVAGTFEEKSAGDKQSGFGRIAMFFTRKRGDKLCLLDPIVNSGAQGTANFFELGTYNGSEVSLNEGIVLGEEGLYWRTTQATKANESELTVSSIPQNVRVGSLCMVDNVVYRIKTITGSVITLEGSLTEFDSTKAENPDSTKTVYFALALVIDNTIEESMNVIRNNSTGQLTRTITPDDGDGFAENISMTGGEGTWYAYLDSSNMLDGTINMSFVAFDAAGNTSSKTIIQKISNNAPRIAGVKFGADKNLDGEVTDGTSNTPNEMITGYQKFKNVTLSTGTLGGTYNGQDEDGNWITDYNNPFADENEKLVIKGAIKVIPEIVGGNIGLGYTCYANKNGSIINMTTDGVVDFGVDHSSDGSIRTDSSIKIEISLLDFLRKNISDGDQNMVFTIWDKTDGYTWDGNTNPGSESAKITIPVRVMIDDTVEPTTEIKPLYWTNSSENSIYQNSQKYGHIELESDLKFTNSPFDSNNSGIFDLDPKLSGKVTFEVTAEDNVVVDIIKVKINEYNDGKAFEIAKRSGSGWTSDNMASDTVSLLGEDARDWVFELVSDEYDSETGKNTVKFKFSFNTEKVTDKAHADVGITFIAVDKGSPSREAATLGQYPTLESAKNISVEGTNPGTGKYKVDVVPYIADIYTQLSSLKKNNWSVYGRTALGHYSVASTETFKVLGFNLEGETTGASLGETYSSYKMVDVAASGISSSGEFSLSTNGIDTINNINSNDSKGSYTGSVDLTENPTGDYTKYKNYYYNRKPNNDNNNLLTDDVYIDVWDVDSNAAVPFNNSGKIVQPVMKINPVTDQLGFAFASSSGYFSMPGKTIEAQAGSSNWNRRFATSFRALTDYSYTYWSGELNEFESVSLAYDSFGHSYGTAAGGNINSGSTTRTDFFSLFTDRWGKGWGDISDGNNNGRHKSSKSGYNAIRLEPTGIELEDGSKVLDKGRIRRPSLVTATHGATEETGDTSVYLAYYDTLTGEIRFRLGNTSDKANTSNFVKISGYSSDSKEYKGGFGNNSLSDGNRVNIFSSNNASSFVAGPYIVQNYVQNSKFQLVTEDGTIIDTDYTNHYFQLVPEQSKGNFGTFNDRWGTDPSQNKSNIGKDNYGNVAVIAGIPGREAGDYFALGVIPGSTKNDDTVFIIWYDEAAATLYYSYATDYTTEENIKNNKTAAGWSSKIRVFPENSDLANAGEYCQIIADANGGVHIAAYDPSNLDLVYAYLSSDKNGKPTETADFTSCVVDANGIVGDSLTIDVALNSEGKAIPTIGYYGSSSKKPKMAYLVNTNADNITGSINDCFTGIWECSIIPTSKTLDFSNKNLVNLGMIKDINGNIKNSARTASSDYENFLQSGEAYYGAHWGIKYGNGTSNAVLGYVVKMSSSLMHIETAQLR